MNDTGRRIREERERLGLSQTAFGALGGVKKIAQLNYEKGDRAPDTDYLRGIASGGADVVYIVTGVRAGDAEEFLAKVEERLRGEALPVTPQRLSEDGELRAMRDRAREVAADQSVEERTVNRARLLLRLAFDDEEQELLARRRALNYSVRNRVFGTAYAAAVKEMGWVPPRQVIEALKMAHTVDLTPEVACHVLGMLRSALDEACGAAGAVAPRGGRRPA